MVLKPEELALARAYVQHTPMESLTREQIKMIMDRGRLLYHWSKDHPNIHAAINLSVLAFLLTADYLVLMVLPRLLLIAGEGNPTGWILLAAVVYGSVHSGILYSLGVFSVHEGAAHQIIFPPRGPVTRILNLIANNLCRLAATEPNYYAENHMSHHAKFGTEQDGEFLNFILPRRFWLTLLPLAAFVNYTDFVAHRPLNYTGSRIVSAMLSISYHLVYGWFMAQRFGALFPVVAFFLFLPHVGFFLDRLRQFTEHNLMPLENKDGSRSLGFGFWGMLVGGGPWGSPCHWEHHLVASLPWYQQLALHRFVVQHLTASQRKQYLLEPVVGFPKLLWRLIHEPQEFVRKINAVSQTGSS